MSSNRSKHIDLRTTNADIYLATEEPPVSVTALSTNGSIDIEIPDRGTMYAVDATTLNGEVVVAIKTDPGASQTIRAETVNGHVTIESRR